MSKAEKKIAHEEEFDADVDTTGIEFEEIEPDDVETLNFAEGVDCLFD